MSRLEVPPAGWRAAIVPAVLAWLGSVAFIGQFRPNEVAGLLARAAGLGLIFWTCAAVSAAGIVAMAVGGRRPHAVLWAAVTGYLVGHAVFAWLPVHAAIDFRIPFKSSADGWMFVKHRLTYGVCVVGCTAVFVLLCARALGSGPRFHFGVGSWWAQGRDFTHRSRVQSYAAAMVGFGVFAAVLWVVGQAGVGFGPLRTGLLWAVLPGVVAAAVTNALVEEMIYRGLLQPAFVHAAGIARGLWIQGLMFGMLHWGMSVGVVAALPTSLLIGIGSVYWGKAVLDTKGLSWVIVAHAMVDVAIMSAYFVPRG
ncbi:MAG: CPBP family intramembrane metalloprotease [Phycisphaerales bacterium]|nr:CPBP family intramembrane metalloprotease [Phycisphaerales bacterium]